MKKKYFRESFQISSHNLKNNYHPSENLKINNLAIFQSLIFRILMEKSLQFLSISKVDSKYFGLIWVKNGLSG